MASSVQSTSDGHNSSFSSSTRSHTTDTTSATQSTFVNINDEQGTTMENKGNNNIKKAIELYQAALKGDWEAAKGIFKEDSSWITKKITIKKNTALHVAAAAKRIGFVEELVKLYCSNNHDLFIKNGEGHTALFYAAISGVVRIAEAIVKNDDQRPGNSDVNYAHLIEYYVPLLTAVIYKRKEMASYLFSLSKEVLQPEQQFQLLLATIDSDYYDIALDILKVKSGLAKWREKENGDTALHLLARKPYAIGSSNQLSCLKKYISRFNRVYKTALMQTLAHQVVECLCKFVVENLPEPELRKFITTPSSLLHDAARVGNVEFLIILIRSYPDFIWIADKDSKTIFHVAVEYRQENVFSLIHEIGGVKDFIVNGFNQKNDCNILHLVGMLASPYRLSKVSGTALQMQYEFRWFKEVEEMVTPSHCKMKIKRDQPKDQKPGDQPRRKDDVIDGRTTREPVRKDDDIYGLTPRELFSKKHEDLREKGEEWIRKTANSCMLVATLITTMVFAASFTVRGGNGDYEDVISILQTNVAFKVFIVFDVAALHAWRWLSARPSLLRMIKQR
ncbi:hypothetical protein IC582_029549 [Cucumis melo]